MFLSPTREGIHRRTFVGWTYRVWFAGLRINVNVSRVGNRLFVDEDLVLKSRRERTLNEDACFSDRNRATRLPSSIHAATESMLKNCLGPFERFLRGIGERGPKVGESRRTGRRSSSLATKASARYLLGHGRSGEPVLSNATEQKLDSIAHRPQGLRDRRDGHGYPASDYASASQGNDQPEVGQKVRGPSRRAGQPEAMGVGGGRSRFESR